MFLWSSPPFQFDIVVDGLNLVEDPSAAIASIVVIPEFFGNVIFGSIGVTLTGPNQVTMGFSDLGVVNCATALCARLTVDLTFADASDAPESVTLALVGLCLLGLGIARRH